MNEQILRRAVELAEGWRDHGFEFTCDELPMSWLFNRSDENAFNEDGFQIALDSLAAQLTRQVEAGSAIEDYRVFSGRDGEILIYRLGTLAQRDSLLSSAKGPDRTENTITAIVEFADKHPEVFRQ